MIYLFLFLLIDIWVVSTGIDTVPFWYNVDTPVLTYMHFGRHMYAFLMGMSTYRSRSAGSQCRNMFNVCRHYWTVFQNLYQLTLLPMVSHCTDWSILFQHQIPLYHFQCISISLWWGTAYRAICAFNFACPDSQWCWIVFICFYSYLDVL